MITVTWACQGCGACLLTCPERAIRPAPDGAIGVGPLAVLASLCTGCGECVEICPVDAIEFTTGFGRTSASKLVSCVAGEAKGEGETA